MKLYMHPASITSRIVRLYIAEKGLDVEEEVVDLFTGAHHQEPFVTINPNRLVPVLEDGDFRLTESAAILIYLAEKFDFPEYPKDVEGAREGQRGDVLGKLQLLPRLGLQPRLSAALPAPQAAERRGRTGWRWSGAATRAPSGCRCSNEHWLGDGRTWLTGEAMTVADYYVGGLVALGDMIRWDFAKTPNVAAWLGRMKALPHWGEVSAALDGFAASLKDREFVIG